MFSSLQYKLVDSLLLMSPVGALDGQTASGAGGELTDTANQIITWMMWAGLVVCLAILVMGVIRMAAGSGNPQGRNAGILMLVFGGLGIFLLYNITDIFSFFTSL